MADDETPWERVDFLGSKGTTDTSPFHSAGYGEGEPSPSLTAAGENALSLVEHTDWHPSTPHSRCGTATAPPVPRCPCSAPKWPRGNARIADPPAAHEHMTRAVPGGLNRPGWLRSAVCSLPRPPCGPSAGPGPPYPGLGRGRGGWGDPRARPARSRQRGRGHSAEPPARPSQPPARRHSTEPVALPSEPPARGAGAARLPPPRTSRRRGGCAVPAAAGGRGPGTAAAASAAAAARAARGARPPPWRSRRSSSGSTRPPAGPTSTR